MNPVRCASGAPSGGLCPEISQRSGFEWPAGALHAVNARTAMWRGGDRNRLAQTGRAGDLKSPCRGFESRALFQASTESSWRDNESRIGVTWRSAANARMAASPAPEARGVRGRERGMSRRKYASRKGRATIPTLTSPTVARHARPALEVWVSLRPFRSARGQWGPWAGVEVRRR